MTNQTESQKPLKKLNDGKFFEMIVEGLQSLLADDGVSVKRRQEYFSEGKKVGEVDIVIEGKIGSSKIKIGVECRDRIKVPGVDWIQQIMGRRLALAKFGFNHWIAVSRKGFASTAIALAKEQNIDLLIPSLVEPVDKDKPGFHTFMKLNMTYPQWKPAGFSGGALFDDEKVSKELEDEIVKILRFNPPDVNHCGLKPIPLMEFLKPSVDAYTTDLEKTNKPKPINHSHIFKFNELDASLNGVDFKFDEIRCEVEFTEANIHPNFQIMAFTAPEIEKKPREILAIIGINEFESQLDVGYILVGIQPSESRKFIFLLRDKEGNPVKDGRKFLFSLPGFTTKPPKK